MIRLKGSSVMSLLILPTEISSGSSCVSLIMFGLLAEGKGLPVFMGRFKGVTSTRMGFFSVGEMIIGSNVYSVGSVKDELERTRLAEDLSSEMEM